MKLYKKIIIAVLVSIITILGGIFNWINQFVIVGGLFFIITFLLIDNKIKKWITVLFLLSPFILVYGVFAIYVKQVHVYPIVFISIINTFLGFCFKLRYLKSLKKKTIIILASIYLALFIAGGYVFMYNWLNYIFKEEAVLQTETISDIKVYDFSDNEIKLDEIDNKVIVLDFWSLYCGYCFLKFSELEKIKSYYNDNEVVFYAIYIQRTNYDEDNNLTERLKWIEEQNYTFNIAKTDSITAEKLGIKAVPHLLVFDKNKELALNSGFGFQERFVINNLYSVINKLLAKP